MDKKIGYKDILQQKEYMKIIMAALINRFGDSIDAIASSWIVYEITGNAAWSAIIYALNKIPTVLITPLAGAWVEGRNKKMIMVGTDIIRAACVATVATGYLFGFLQAWILVLTTLAISTVEAFRGPANIALTPKVLEKKYYEYGMALMSTSSVIVELIGTALAASIIALLGTAGAIYVDVATFLLSALIIAIVDTKEQEYDKKQFDMNEYLDTLKSGMAYISEEQTIMFFCIVAVFVNGILVPFNSLKAPLVNEILHGGAEVLSILGIALTGGMIIGSTLFPLLRKYLSSRGVVFLSCSGVGVYYLGLIVCMPFYANKYFMYMYVAVTSTMFGFVASLFNSFVNVELIKHINASYLARVASVTTAICSAATPVVSFIVSIVALFVKTEWIYVVAGVIDLLMIPVFLRSKALDERKESEFEELTGVATVE